MENFKHTSQREYLPGKLEIDYKDFRRNLEEYDLWEDVDIDEESYKDSELSVKIEFLGYHEDWTWGDVTFVISNQNAADQVKLNRVDRSDIVSLLEDGEVTEETSSSKESTIEYELSSKRKKSATD